MLSKTDLLSLLQCPRKLWLEHNNPELVPKGDLTLYRRATDGRIVDEKARELLGPDVIWPPSADDEVTASNSAKDLLTKSPQKAAVEVPMVHSELYARADALLPGNKSYILLETKAKTFPLKKDKVTPSKPEDHHLDDVAIQTWAMEGFGIIPERVELNLLDSQWQYPGNNDYTDLFRQLDVTNEAIERKNNVEEWMQNAKAILAGEIPPVVTGKQCSRPYACPFIEYCKTLDPPMPDHPIELLPDSAGKKLASKLRETKGYTSILDPDPEELTGKNAVLYRRVQSAHRTGEAILETGSDIALNALPYPRYYFDFEAIDLPVPRWAGVRPYEHIPFQWACHIERSQGNFEHEEFLDLTGDDPSEACIKHLSEVINPDDNGPIIVYYATYEKLRLEGLAKRHPNHAKLLRNYIERLFDLHPIVKQYYYHPQMNGSFSIKSVLPVIAPDLDYAELEEIQEGTGAQVGYLYATLDTDTTPERKVEIETNLRAYCRQDTWAMVEIAYFLARVGKPRRPTGM